MESKQKPAEADELYARSTNQDLTEEEKQRIAPMAMAELEIMKAARSKSVADKNPEIRSIALLLAVIVGVTLFGQISSYAIIASFSDTQTDFLSLFVSSSGVLGIATLLIQIVAIFILLFTHSTSRAKTIILIIGIAFGVTVVTGALSFQIGPTMIANLAILAVNFLIFRKILKLYLEL